MGRITNRLACGGVVAQLVESQASNRKVMKPWVDFQCVSALLCPWERQLMLLPIFRLVYLRLWWSSLTKDMQIFHGSGVPPTKVFLRYLGPLQLPLLLLTLSFQSVPGHAEFPGNELADSLVKAGATLSGVTRGLSQGGGMLG